MSKAADLSIVDDDASMLWFVTVVLSGEPVDVDTLRAGLQRYGTDHSFATSLRYSADRVEVSYWDEGAQLADVAESALLTWSEARQALRLPGWQVVGLEVLDQTTVRERGTRGRAPEFLVPGDIRPLR